MKTLLVVRHAKAKRGPEFTSDLDRPLAKRGKGDIEAVAMALAAAGLVPQRLLSSPAKRARQTATRLCEAMACDAEIEIYDDLYFGDVPEHLELLRRLEDDTDIAAIVGHNPTLEELVASLTSLAVPLGTCHVAQLAVPGEWASLGPAGATLQRIWTPDRSRGDAETEEA